MIGIVLTLVCILYFRLEYLKYPHGIFAMPYHIIQTVPDSCLFMIIFFRGNDIFVSIIPYLKNLWSHLSKKIYICIYTITGFVGTKKRRRGLISLQKFWNYLHQWPFSYSILLFDQSNSFFSLFFQRFQPYFQIFQIFQMFKISFLISALSLRTVAMHSTSRAVSNYVNYDYDYESSLTFVCLVYYGRTKPHEWANKHKSIN